MMRLDETGNERTYPDLEREQPYIILEVKR